MLYCVEFCFACFFLLTVCHSGHCICSTTLRLSCCCRASVDQMFNVRCWVRCLAWPSGCFAHCVQPWSANAFILYRYTQVRKNVQLQLLDLSIVAPGRTLGHRPLFIFSSLICCRLRLPPAVLISCCPYFKHISSRCRLVIVFLCGHVASTGVLAWQCCRCTTLECAQANSLSSLYLVQQILFSLWPLVVAETLLGALS